MDLSTASASSSKHSKEKRAQRCNRCHKLGHFAYECLAPSPTPRARAGSQRSSSGPPRAAVSQQREKPKNGKSQ
jgi:hypothetical protein